MTFFKFIPLIQLLVACSNRPFSFVLRSSDPAIAIGSRECMPTTSCGYSRYAMPSWPGGSGRYANDEAASGACMKPSPARSQSMRLRSPIAVSILPITSGWPNVSQNLNSEPSSSSTSTTISSSSSSSSRRVGDDDATRDVDVVAAARAMRQNECPGASDWVEVIDMALAPRAARRSCTSE